MWKDFKRIFWAYPLAYLAKILMRLTLFTCRIEVHGLEQFLEAAQKEKTILMLWHNRLAILPEILQRYAASFTYCAFISKSQDGELLAILTKSYKIGQTLRVPHTARHQALSRMISQLKSNEEIMVLTPDGPRGPRYQVKPGIILAAKKASACITPVSWSASHFWQLNSWDKLIFPKPFSRIVASFGDPISLEHSSSKTFGSDINTLTQALSHLTQDACSAISKNRDKWPR